MHYKGEQHKEWLKYGKVIPESFPWATPMCPTPLQGMIICVNEKALLHATANAQGAWLAATMVAFAHLQPHLQPAATHERLDAQMELRPYLHGSKIALVCCQRK